MPRILLASIAPWKQILLCDSSLVSFGVQHHLLPPLLELDFEEVAQKKTPFVPDLFPTCSFSRTWGISDILHNMSYAHRCPGATTYRSAFEDCGWWDTDQRISKRFFGADLSLLLMLRKLIEILLTTRDPVSNPKTNVFRIRIVKDQLVQDFDISSINECWWKIDARFRAVEWWRLDIADIAPVPPNSQIMFTQPPGPNSRCCFHNFPLKSFN